VLYRNEHHFRLALCGMNTYRLSWFGAHLWLYAEHYRLREILSAEFSVRDACTEA
jgi:hypothetical protein